MVGLTPSCARPAGRADPPRGWTGAALSALRWQSIGTAGRALAQLGLGLLLARLLGPEPFGQVAVVWLVIGLGQLLAEGGLGASLVQQSTLHERDIRLAFTRQMAFATLLTTGMVLLAPLLARFYRQPGLALVLQAAAPVFLLQAFGATSAALLRRTLRHDRLQTLQLGSYLLGYGAVALPLAWYGAGVWALVTAQAVQAAAFSIAAWGTVRHAVRPLWARSQYRPAAPFARGVLASNLSSWACSYLDTALIGRLCSLAELGLYNRVMGLFTTPMNSLVSALQGVIFPLAARLQDRPDAVRQLYLGALSLVSTLLMPCFAAIAAVPDRFVPVVYGPAWSAGSVLVTPLALAMPLNGILAMAGPVLLGLGRSGREAASQAFGALLLGALVVAATPFGLGLVAWAVFTGYAVRALLVSRLAAGWLQLGWGALARALAGPLLMAAGSAATAAGVDAMLHARLPAAPCLALDLAGAWAVAFGLWHWAGRRLLGAPALALFDRMAPRLPTALHPGGGQAA